MSYHFDLHSIGDLSGAHADQTDMSTTYQRLMHYQVIATLAVAERLERQNDILELVAERLIALQCCHVRGGRS